MRTIYTWYDQQWSYEVYQNDLGSQLLESAAFGNYIFRPHGYDAFYNQVTNLSFTDGLNLLAFEDCE